jgi:GT2 family glycosyltransferase
MTRAAIVIVTCNSGAEIGPCLDAALRTGAEILVVDNGSSDDTLQQVASRGVPALANRENRGFAAAVNQGVRALDAPLILLLNPDAVLVSGLDDLARACEEPRSAGAGGKLVAPNGAPQEGFFARALPTPASMIFEALLINRIWRRNPVNLHYRNIGLDHSKARTVEQPAGAFLMIRRDVWQRLDGFDERFHPLWFEDVDFCRRARDQGWVFHYIPTAVAAHVGAHSLRNVPFERRQMYWYGSLLRYSAVHFSILSHRMVCAAVAAGAIVRMGIGAFARRSPAPCKTAGKVALLAVKELCRGRRGDPWPGSTVHE